MPAHLLVIRISIGLRLAFAVVEHLHCAAVGTEMEHAPQPATSSTAAVFFSASSTQCDDHTDGGQQCGHSPTGGRNGTAGLAESSARRHARRAEIDRFKHIQTVENAECEPPTIAIFGERPSFCCSNCMPASRARRLSSLLWTTGRSMRCYGVELRRESLDVPGAWWRTRRAARAAAYSQHNLGSVELIRLGGPPFELRSTSMHQPASACCSATTCATHVNACKLA